jgi:hypothetical protein
MDTISKIQNVRARDKEVQKQYALNKRDGERLMPFRQFRKRLAEAQIVSDIEDSMLATLSINATKSDVDDVARGISILTQVGAVIVTAIAITPEN